MTRRAVEEANRDLIKLLRLVEVAALIERDKA